MLRHHRRPRHPTLATPRSNALCLRRAARRWLPLAAMLAGCGPVGPSEPLGTSHAALAVDGVTGCSTDPVDGLAQQLIAEQNCIRPNALVSFAGTPNVSIASGVYAYLEPAAAAGLAAAAQQTPLSINSAFRTLPEQYLLFRWYSNGQQCGIGLAASPGDSNHETGTAVDVDNYGAAYSAMTSNGWTQSYPSNDAVHYDYTAGGTIDLRSDSVLAFQRLWNLNNPGDPIAEDGSYGPMTAARLGASPAEGFAAGPTCATPAEPAWPPLVHRSPVDLDGDGMADVCARAASGIVCSLSSGGSFSKEIAGPAWTDANGWAKPQYGSTIQYGDIDGDGRADVCARAVTGMICHPSKVTGASDGGFGAQLDGPAWSDANGWADARYYSTIQLADVNGDGKADLCGRSSAGIGCALAVDGGFSPEIAGPAWSDANAWGNVAYYGTIQFADVNGDGKADVCARASDGIVCNLSDGNGFPTEIHGPAWSDANGWAAVAHGSSIRFADVNGDGKADVCARQSDGILCNLSDGAGFPTVVYGPAWSDANGWSKPEYFTTIQYADVNGDGKADVCGRAASGIVCALSDGAGFPTEVKGPAWGDGAGWNQPQYFATIGAGDVNGDGKDDLCARDSQGLTCAPATGGEFGPTFSGPSWGDASGWASATYYSTVRLLGGPRELAHVPDGGVDAGDGGPDHEGWPDGAVGDAAPGGASPDAAAPSGRGDGSVTSDGGGCACAVAGASSRGSASRWLAGVGALALLCMRRRARPASR